MGNDASKSGKLDDTLIFPGCMRPLLAVKSALWLEVQCATFNKVSHVYKHQTRQAFASPRFDGRCLRVWDFILSSTANPLA